jgi:hypothetical protein
MIQRFHEARRHEEGQALILASISMLILAMCILATVNLAYAAKQRIQVQNAADAAAYTTAAYEARAMNLLAYTNRAMIVHYVSQMNLMAILSFMNFNFTLINGVIKILSNVPVLGIILQIIGFILQVISLAYTILLIIALPYIDGMTYRLSLMQVGIVNGLQDRITKGSVQEVQQYNPRYLAPVMLSKTLLGIDDMDRWGPNGTMVAVTPTPTMQARDELARTPLFERLVMVEMANAARPQFTAMGTRRWSFPFGFPREWGGSCPPSGSFGICIEKHGRTEWGALVTGDPTGIAGFLNTVLSNAFSSTEQIFSLDRFALQFKVFGVLIGFSLDSWAYADRGSILDNLVGAISQVLGIGTLGLPSQGVRFGYVISGGNAIARFLARLIIGPFLATFVTQMNGFISNIMTTIKGFLPLFHFGMWPYARFRPAPTTGAIGISSKPGASQLFNQPPVLLMVTAPKSAITANGRPFLGGFGFKLGGFHSSGRPVDAAYAASRNKRASKRGYVDQVNFDPGDNPLPFITTEGFHAISAAMAYYHRPGDWREPPNLFNPMWGAKLMPVMDYPTIAQNASMADLLGKGLLVH